MNGDEIEVRDPADPPLNGLSHTIYAQLRAIAQSQMNGERNGHTLSATALVHEACMRMESREGFDGWFAGAQADERRAFLGAAGEAMRRILIEYARSRSRLKRGGGRVKADIDLEVIGEVADFAIGEKSETFLAFDSAFERLKEHDARFAEVVRLRFYAGLTVDQTAAVLGVSERTVNNDWAYARAWLARELRSSQCP